MNWPFTYDNHRKELEMTTDEHPDDQVHRTTTTVGAGGPEWAARATMARVSQWSSDRHVDPGDTHDKGEPSLCIGEGA